MKVLFLDFDGVINPFMKFSSTGEFSKACCANVNLLLIKVPTLRIVVSSSWRTYGLAACRDILKANGIDPTKVIDITEMPAKDRGLDREHHIERWLRLHPETVNFVILDDEAEIPDLKKKYVETNSYVGLTSSDVDRALKILGEDSKLH